MLARKRAPGRAAARSAMWHIYLVSRLGSVEDAGLQGCRRRLGHGLGALCITGQQWLEGGLEHGLWRQRRHPRRSHRQQRDGGRRHVWHNGLAGQHQRSHGGVRQVDSLHGQGRGVGRHGQCGVHGQAGQDHSWSKVLGGSGNGGHVCSRDVRQVWRKAVKPCQRSNCRNDRKLRNLKKIQYHINCQNFH